MALAKVLIVEHEADAGIGLIGSRLLEHGITLETVGPARGRAVPNSLEGFDALIVLGGAMGPVDDDIAPWLPATRALLALGVEAGIPILAVCLGAQLLVTATGGTVREMQAGPEIGLCSIEVLDTAEADPLFSPLRGATVPTVQWHWLDTESLPPDTVLLASNPVCAHQAFRLGSRAWGVQFHPEALTQTASRWCAEDAEAIDSLGLNPEQIIDGVRAAEALLAQTWGGLTDRFAHVVLQGLRRVAAEAV